MADYLNILRINFYYWYLWLIIWMFCILINLYQFILFKADYLNILCILLLFILFIADYLNILRIRLSTMRDGYYSLSA